MVERFDPKPRDNTTVVLRNPHGNYVRHSDYARLQEQLEAVTRERDEAKAEVARYWTSADMKPWCDLAESKGLGHFGKKLKGMFSRAMKAEDEARIEFDRAEAAEARAARLEAALRRISDMCPATQEMTVAHMMADEAEAALDVKEAG